MVGVGLQRSRDDKDYSMGHMWIRWDEAITNIPNIQRRGYYPIIEEIPDMPASQVRTYLCTNEVPGMYMDDNDARDIEIGNNRGAFLSKDWDFTQYEINRLIIFCHIPGGKSWVQSGFYSCGLEFKNADNCSSWAIKALKFAKCDQNFIHCDIPKRLAFVERAIWGSINTTI